MSEPISYSLKGAAAAVGLSPTTVERHLRTGRIKGKKSDVDENGQPCGVWIVPAESLKEFVAGLVDA